MTTPLITPLGEGTILKKEGEKRVIRKTGETNNGNNYGEKKIEGKKMIHDKKKNRKSDNNY